MNKMALVVICMLISLFSSCSTTEQLVMNPLYSVTESTVKDIKGDYTVHRLLIYKKISISTNEIITIDKISNDKKSVYYYCIEYIGPDWLNIDKIEQKIDGKYSFIKDNHPFRKVNNSTNISVTEIANFMLKEEDINRLLKCNEIVLQYYLEPIYIDKKGIDCIKDFIR